MPFSWARACIGSGLAANPAVDEKCGGESNHRTREYNVVIIVCRLKFESFKLRESTYPSQWAQIAVIGAFQMTQFFFNLTDIFQNCDMILF